MANLWRADLTTFAGYAYNAEHYYAKLLSPCGRWEIEYGMSADQAKIFDDKDQWSIQYKEGDATGRFFSKEAAEQAAIVAFQSVCEAPSKDLLLKGMWSAMDPSRPLAGNTELVTACERLFLAAQECGFWEGDEKAMAKICEEWDALMAPLNKHYPDRNEVGGRWQHFNVSTLEGWVE